MTTEFEAHEFAYSHSVPDNLFIPPDALQLLLDVFSGPLDLLLYLVRHNNMDINKVDVALITEQYIAYVDQVDRHNFALISEYLEMSAWLIELKSRLLLPKVVSEDEEEEEDPQALLQERLRRYLYFRAAADALLEHTSIASEKFIPTPLYTLEGVIERPHIEPSMLHDYFLRLLQREQLQTSYNISSSELSVEARKSFVMQMLAEHHSIKFSACFTKEESVNGVVVAMIAVLMLMREGVLDFIDQVGSQPVLVRCSNS